MEEEMNTTPKSINKLCIFSVGEGYLVFGWMKNSCVIIAEGVMLLLSSLKVKRCQKRYIWMPSPQEGYCGSFVLSHLNKREVCLPEFASLYCSGLATKDICARSEGSCEAAAIFFTFCRLLQGSRHCGNSHMLLPIHLLVFYWLLPPSLPTTAPSSASLCLGPIMQVEYPPLLKVSHHH